MLPKGVTRDKTLTLHALTDQRPLHYKYISPGIKIQQTLSSYSLLRNISLFIRISH